MFTHDSIQTTHDLSSSTVVAHFTLSMYNKGSRPVEPSVTDLCT